MSVTGDRETTDRGHECDAPVEFLVGDESPVRIPVVGEGARLYERKQGPTSITRRAEISIPIEYEGRVWTDEITAFTEGGAIQPAELRFGGMTDSDTFADPTPVFRGYVGAVGSASNSNVAQVSVFDPATFLSRIEAGITFTKETTVDDVLAYLRDEFIDSVDVFDNLLIDSSARDQTVTQYVSVFGFDKATRVPGRDKGGGRSVGGSTFSTNRDTLADVLTWLQTRTGVHVEFQPTNAGYGLRLVVSDTPPSVGVDLTDESDGYPLVIDNQALYEMRPFNALRLKGDKGFNLTAFGQRLRTPFGNEYPEVIAKYTPLEERFGGLLVETDTSPLNNQDRLEEATIAQLKERLDEVSGGSITTTFAPDLRPFDRVDAKPACRGVTADVDQLQYEVQRAVHAVVPDDDYDDVGVPHTELAVSIRVDPSKIAIENSTKKDAQPSKGGDNKPPTGGGRGLNYDIE